ncbi:hypothetical protein PFICI_08007 [Pestalotiopsis fici W106-1]|uniref:Cytochrome P450 n=1 Tax=Pestalotiopsis fici (strain W106-1 / CGMCC3.15140) TaxID=1229662 RepID=W3X2V5_PESFW|nr:uncharacterized protein PFICI_08007 [Pestalotiopsis fici W106-1]ETS80478.1 hypothetical protein PFICI_08007 [Pestalotiopsis fici W106-1]
MALLVGLLDKLRAQSQNQLAVVVVIIFALVLRFILRLRPSLPSNAPELYKGHNAVFGLHPFSSSRADYLERGVKQSSNGHFSFWYGGNHIVVLSGEAARTSFLTARGLDPSAGFMALFGAFLNVDELTSANTRKSSLVYKRCAQEDHLSTNLHHLVTDSDNALRKIGVAGVIDPLKFIGSLIYQLTHRMAGAHDIASDPQLLQKTLNVYGPLEDSPYIDVLFPWLPTPSKLGKMVGYARLHFTIQGIVKKRRAGAKRDTDMLQKTIDEGFSDGMISLIVIGAILAGVFNTTLATTWNLCCLAKSPAWLAKVKKEVNDTIDRHRLSDSEPLLDVFQRFSLKEWETQFPILQLTIKESIRFTMAGAVVRKNISGKDMSIGGTHQVVPNNSLAIHATADAHMSEGIYTEPLKWDPDRFSGARAEGVNVPHSYLGWGSGNHPCRNISNFAELNVVVANVLFIASYDFHMCDKTGRKIDDPLPDLIYNRMGAGRPRAEMYMKCQARS